MKLAFEIGMVECMDALAMVSRPDVVDDSPQLTASSCSDEELVAVIQEAEAAMRAAMATQLRGHRRS